MPSIPQTFKGINKKYFFIILLILLISSLVIIKTQAKEKDSSFTYIHPVQEDITQTLEISGHINAKLKARLRFIAGGKLTYLGAQEGDWVKKWQTIATIDQASLNKYLQKDLNLYMKKRWDWEETRDNIKDRSLETTERRSVDKNHWDLKNTVLDVEIRDIAIKNTAIYAPFSGILTHSPTTTNGVQLLSTDYFEVVDPNSLIFRGIVDESDIASVSTGQNASIILDSFPDKLISATINYIAYTSTETNSGTSFIVEFTINESDEIKEKLRIGMNGDANITINTKKDTLTIPSITLIQKDNDIFVKTKKNNKENEEKRIVIGLETDDKVEVLEGLTTQDEVLLPKQNE